jgi:hypothetical protein
VQGVPAVRLGDGELVLGAVECVPTVDDAVRPWREHDAAVAGRTSSASNGTTRSRPSYSVRRDAPTLAISAV